MVFFLSKIKFKINLDLRLFYSLVSHFDWLSMMLAVSTLCTTCGTSGDEHVIMPAVLIQRTCCYIYKFQWICVISNPCQDVLCMLMVAGRD